MFLLAFPLISSYIDWICSVEYVQNKSSLSIIVVSAVATGTDINLYTTRNKRIEPSEALV